MQAPPETTEHAQPAPHPQPHPEGVEIHVNEQPVHLVGHRHTGLQIKEAAIGQGVKIELDFLLYLERHETNKPIDDDQEVTVTDHSRFEAISDDDNS